MYVLMHSIEKLCDDFGFEVYRVLEFSDDHALRDVDMISSNLGPSLD
jgi:hypothetical protein